jgi:hypothetical protein
MSYLVKALQNLNPNAEFTFTDDDYETIVWHVIDGTKPTLKQIEDEIESIKKSEAETLKDNAAKKQALLTRLGLNEEDVRILLS